MARLFLPAIAGLALFLVACGSSDSADGKLRVVATTTQIGDFARNVAGDRIALTVLLSPNQDAHDFELSPSDVRAIAGADLVLRNGVGLDAFVNKALAQSDAEVAVLANGIELHEGHEEHEAHADEDEDAEAEAAGHDPHVWFAVANARVMVENLRDALVTADPTNAPTYNENARVYDQRLQALDAKLRSTAAALPSACRKLVTNHDVLGYYANAYGFEIVGSVIPSLTTEAQPSASDVADIVKRIREQRVPAIFAESSANPGLIRQVGREAGVTVVEDLYGDSLGAKGSDGATYETMMETNTRKIVAALTTCRP